MEQLPEKCKVCVTSMLMMVAGCKYLVLQDGLWPHKTVCI